MHVQMRLSEECIAYRLGLNGTYGVLSSGSLVLLRTHAHEPIVEDEQAQGVT